MRRGETAKIFVTTTSKLSFFRTYLKFADEMEAKYGSQWPQAISACHSCCCCHRRRCPLWAQVVSERYYRELDLRGKMS